MRIIKLTLAVLFITTIANSQRFNRYRAWRWDTYVTGGITNLDTIIQGVDWPERKEDVAKRFWSATVDASKCTCTDSYIAFGGSNDTIGISGDSVVYSFERIINDSLPYTIVRAKLADTIRTYGFEKIKYNRTFTGGNTAWGFMRPQYRWYKGSCTSTDTVRVRLTYW